MKTIFAKYNRGRLPAYQIVTKIIQNDDDTVCVRKEPLCDEAKPHIQKLLDNYEKLKQFSQVRVVSCRQEGDGAVFEQAQGVSLESILVQAVLGNDKATFDKYLQKYLDFVDGFVAQCGVVFEPSEAFIEVFGEWTDTEPQDIVKCANVDLIFSNIFVDENDDFTLIDYEWVFDFAVPKKIIVWRALYALHINHGLGKWLPSFDVGKYFKNEQAFQDFVCGQWAPYRINERIRKNILRAKGVEFCEEVPHIQLFIDRDAGDEYKKEVLKNQESQVFVFNLTSEHDIENLQICLLNGCCVVEVEHIEAYCKSQNRTIRLTSGIYSNALFNQGKRYFFPITVPQIMWKCGGSPLRDVIQIAIQLKYIHMFDEAVSVSIQEFSEQKRIELEQCIGSYQKSIDAYQNSLSWRITKPLRWMMNRARYFLKVIQG